MSVETLIQFRKGLAETWTNVNPTLGLGEPGYESDTGKLKIGDGSTTWTSLNYVNETIQLSTIDDVSISSPATTNQVLTYSNGNWINKTFDISLIEKGSIPFGGYSDSKMGYYYSWAVGSEAVINEQSNDIDFRVESSNQTHMFFVDSGSNKIGVSTSNPSYELDVNGTFSADSININDEYTFPTTDGNEDQILRTNGSGSISWSNETVLNQTVNGRLTLESGVPLSTTDQTAKTILYFTPYKGNQIALYDSSSWKIQSFSEISLSISGFASDTNYDVFIYDNSGTLTLEESAWTDDTTRSTNIVLQDGVYVKSGSTTKRYLGTIRTTSTTGQCEDSTANRFVWNMYNRKEKQIRKYITANWTYSTNAWRVFNNQSSSTYAINVVSGLGDDLLKIKAGALYASSSTASTVYFISIAEDSTLNITSSANNGTERTLTTSVSQVQLVSTLEHFVPIGYHYYYPIERTQSGVPGIYGSSGGSYWGGLLGFWKC